jgi:hypothetical protein
MLCVGWKVVTGASNVHSAFFFRVKQSSILLGVLYPEANALQPFQVSVTVYQLTQRNIPEDLNHQQHTCENLKSYNIVCTLISQSLSSSQVLGLWVWCLSDSKYQVK